jgi:hypothetical protein
MFDCADDVLAYHDDKVTLPQAERTEMRDRRDANRWSAGSKDAKKPASRRVREPGQLLTAWFETENDNKSPDTDNGRQLRRIVRQIKKYAWSREGWKGQILSGFGITKLVRRASCAGPRPPGSRAGSPSRTHRGATTSHGDSAALGAGSVADGGRMWWVRTGRGRRR